MAVLLRTGATYRIHLAEAMRRAGVPAYVSRGASRPDPSGRGLLALLDCAVDGLSASRFAEYLSLGALPGERADGAPPGELAEAERWVPPASEEGFDGDPSIARAPAEPPANGADAGRSLPTPRLWEKLIVDAAVIGGLDRWKRRLSGLREQLRLAAERCGADDEPAARRLARDLSALGSLEAFALPLLADLAALPARASWSVFRDRLAALATRALARPERVLAVLAELAPMSGDDPIDLFEVRLVLEPRLVDLVTLPAERSYGKVFVGSIEEARGMDFDVVFVPGLTEKVFPERITEDPLFGDDARARTSASLAQNHDRSVLERLALRIAVGAAKRRVYASYPRLDLEQGRPRTPSFYGLELLRAADGALPGFDELSRRAGNAVDARAAWPAPRRRELSVDDAEHDLALLESIFQKPQKETIGTARYLLSANPHLARALRFRARRWLKTWSAADGLVDPGPDGRAALAGYALSARAYSPTTLEQFAACPYKFFLQAVHRLSPRDEPDAVDELDPLTRGAILHAAFYEVHAALRARGLLPVSPESLALSFDVLEEVFAGLEKRFRDDLAPSIARVWDDAMNQIKADLRESLRRDATPRDPADSGFVPVHFELAFGLGALAPRERHDPASRPDAVDLECGVRLRGSIDRVERNREGVLRVTDYKSGKTRPPGHPVVGGGAMLQPVLYALALERMTGATVHGGRLYYATLAAGFGELSVPLDDRAKGAVAEVIEAIGGSLANGFFPAAPDKGACERCNYQMVCGPYEEQRSTRKKSDRLVALQRLRGLP
jgi:RecB family exonuclease